MPAPLRLSFGLPFRDAQAAAAARRVVLPDEFYGRIPDELRQTAFTVSQLTSLQQIADVKQSLDDALASGQSLDEWRKVALARWPQSGPSPSKSYLSLIYRAYSQTAYMAGHWEAFTAQSANRPFLMYSAINDARTRPAHRAMSGYIAGLGDAVWDRWSPPCGFNCRCTLISLSAVEAARRGYGKRELPDVQPDAGWGAKPAHLPRFLDPELADALAKASAQAVATIAQQRAELLPPILDDAVRQALGSTYASTAAHVQDAIDAGAVLARYETEAIAVSALLAGGAAALAAALAGLVGLDVLRRAGALIAGIQQGAGALPTYQGDTTRTVSANDMTPTAYQQFIGAHLHPGAVVQWTAPTPAGQSVQQGDVRFVIHATHAIDTRGLQWHPGDPAALFLAGAAFRVVRVDRVDGKPWAYEVELDEITGSEAARNATPDVDASAFRAANGATPWQLLERWFPQFREANQRIGAMHLS